MHGQPIKNLQGAAPMSKHDGTSAKSVLRYLDKKGRLLHVKKDVHRILGINIAGKIIRILKEVL